MTPAGGSAASPHLQQHGTAGSVRGWQGILDPQICFLAHYESNLCLECCTCQL